MQFLKQHPYVIFTLFIILGTAAYSNTLDVPFYFDDRPNILENKHIRLTELSLDGLKEAVTKSYARNRPIANISFALNYYFHKYNLGGYHVVNIIIHLTTSILVFLLIRMTLSNTAATIDDQHRSPLAAASSLLWLVHPALTQSVTYIVQRMTCMAAMFYILSLVLYIRGRQLSKDSSTWPWFVGSALAALFSIGSKEIAVTLPLFILLYEWFFFQDLSKAWLKKLLPFAAVSILLIYLLAIAFMGTSPLDYILEGYELRNFTMAQRLLTEFRVVMHYIGFLLLPLPSQFNLDYDFPLSNSFFDPITTLLSAAIILSVVAMAIVMARKERLISFCILWFFGNLVMESSIISLEIAYDHRVYIPSIFFVLLIVILMSRMSKYHKSLPALLAIVTLLFSVATYARNGVWKTPVSLWTDVVKKSENKFRPNNNLGLALADIRQYEKAIAYYLKALTIVPGEPGVHNNLGLAFEKMGRFKEAVHHYTQSLEAQPDTASTHYNIANLLEKNGNFEKAIFHYTQATKLKPDYDKAYNNMGVLYKQLGKTEQAIDAFKKALLVRPDYAGAHYNMGLALMASGRVEEAINSFTAVTRLSPRNGGAHYKLAVIFYQIKDFAKAVQHYDLAVKFGAKVHPQMGDMLTPYRQ